MDMGVLRHSDTKQTAQDTDSQNQPPMPKSPRHRRNAWRVFWVLLVMGLVVFGFVIATESRTSRLQAREFSRFSASLSYSLQPGPSDAVLYPGDGPFDKRLGYSALDEFLPRLLKRDYLIVEQTRFSPELLAYGRRGFFVPYEEKIQAGLSITDCRGSDLYQFRYPQQFYPSYAAIPPLVVHSLSLIHI